MPNIGTFTVIKQQLYFEEGVYQNLKRHNFNAS